MRIQAIPHFTIFAKKSESTRLWFQETLGTKSSARLEVCDMRENHKAITPTTNASKSRLQLTQREISPTHHTLILNGFSNSQKASITQHGPRTACAGCIESQNGGIFFAALQAKSAYKTGYWEHLRALIYCVKPFP